MQFECECSHTQIRPSILWALFIRYRASLPFLILRSIKLCDYIIHFHTSRCIYPATSASKKSINSQSFFKYKYIHESTLAILTGKSRTESMFCLRGFSFVKLYSIIIVTRSRDSKTRYTRGTYIIRLNNFYYSPECVSGILLLHSYSRTQAL